MARERLTSKTAEDWMKSKPGTQVEDKGTGIDNDTAAMNNPDHAKNDPKLDSYAAGDPSAWGEDVDKSNMWKKDKRDGSHVPEMTTKQAAESVIAARKLEEKAIKCIVASQRMLPGASDEMIESQAADLMHLPENCVNATLSRQEDLAKLISKAASDSADDAEEDEDKEDDKEESKEDEDKEEKEAAKEEVVEEKEEDETEKMASAIISGDISKLPPALQAAIKKKQDAKKDKEEVVEEKEAAKKEDDKEEVVELEETVDASEETSLLDEIFSSVTASEGKKGAQTLKGMVKKEASEGSSGMDNLWDAPPDVSRVFK
jgi:hypothetical protein